MKPPITDIIIPVYGDLEATRNCIESVFKYLDGTQNLVLINDKSPEEKITKYLKKIKRENPRITLIEHKENLGFVKSVNEGVSLSKTNDVILLNSDTIVTKNWTGKMRKRAYLRDNVATVTPFSNSGGYCSYPKFLIKNKLPKYVTPEDMNFIFNLVPETIIEMPTGTGFCLYIRRKAIDMLGPFDFETFKNGYGEESDFTLRALKAGFANLALENTFIYHVDGASFGPEKAKIVKENWKKLFEKNPDCLDKVLDFEKSDPFKQVRKTARLYLCLFYPFFILKNSLLGGKK